MTADRQGRESAYVALGSNLDDPQRQVENAFDLLAGLPDTQLITRSSLYRSAPFGPVEQPEFVNAAAELLTSLGARELLEHLQAIETSQGRVRKKRWGPRTLDLDLLVYGAQVIDEPRLTVPHPGIGERNFVLLPLREIAPELVIPGLGHVADIPVDENEPRITRID